MCSGPFVLSTLRPHLTLNRKLFQATIIYFRSARKLNNKVESGGERETRKTCRNKEEKKMVKRSRQESAFAFKRGRGRKCSKLFFKGSPSFSYFFPFFSRPGESY